MYPARSLGAIGFLLAFPLAALAQPAPSEATITVPEVEARSGPSDMYYPTSRLSRGERVKVIKEEKGWLAIAPPPGSFSWIDDKVIERDKTGPTAKVLVSDVPVRIGSSRTEQLPNVQQVRLQAGTQVVILGKKEVAQDGVWWPIQPPPQEVRYIPKEATTQGAPPVERTAGSAPTASVPVAPPLVSSAPTQALGSVDPTWQQAEQAERAGDYARAIQLYDQLARQTTNHDLAMRCYSRLQCLREGNFGSVPSGYRPGMPSQASSGGNGNRLVPTPTNNSIPTAAQAYPVSRNTAGYGAPANSPSHYWSGPGYLRRSGIGGQQGQRVYALENSYRQVIMYVSPIKGVDLEPYVERWVNLYGPQVFRGDLRHNFMTVTEVRRVP